MRKVEAYNDLETTEGRGIYLLKNYIPLSDMKRWRNNYSDWCDLTVRQQKKVFVNPKKGKGKFHDQEKKVYATYKKWRSEGLVVTKKRIRTWMKAQCDQDKPLGYDPEKKHFGKSFGIRFCNRWRISSQRRTKRKTSDVFQRMHKIKNYHYWLIYCWQDPSNYEAPYFTYNNYVRKHPAELISENHDVNLHKGTDSSDAELEPVSD